MHRVERRCDFGSGAAAWPDGVAHGAYAAMVVAELIDERPVEVVRRATRRPEGDFERVAGNIARRLLGADVYLQDDGSHDAMPDLRVVHRDGRVEFGEVVTDYDPRYAQMYGELLKQGPGIPLRVEAATLQRVWFVTVDRNCNIQLLKRRAPDLLEALERAGHNYERAGRFGNDEPDDSASELITLGVADLSSRPCAADESGMMLVYPVGVSGSPRPQWDVFLCWLRDRLWDAAWRDVRAKLASSAPGRGHLFIGMTMSTPGDAYFALSDGHRQVPPAPPDLPPEVGGVWITPVVGGGRCLVWTAAHGWRDARHAWSCD